MKHTDLTLPIELNELREILVKNGVTKASVFGSYARNEVRADSDLDLLVTIAPGKSYLDLGGLQDELDKKLPGGVDIATKINKHFAPYIENELVEIL